MTTIQSVTALKGLVKKPKSKVSIKMMHEAISARGCEKKQQKAYTKPPYKVSDLMAECNPNAPYPEDIELWMNMKPVGKEIE